MSVQPLEFVYGINAVGEMIKHNAKAIETIYVVDARDDKRVRKIVEMAEQARLTLTKSSKDDIEAMLASDTEHSVNHQGVIAACRPSQAKDEDFLEALLSRAEQPLSLLILDLVSIKNFEDAMMVELHEDSTFVQDVVLKYEQSLRDESP